jgi:hypothetical protein
MVAKVLVECHSKVQTKSGIHTFIIKSDILYSCWAKRGRGSFIKIKTSVSQNTAMSLHAVISSRKILLESFEIYDGSKSIG